MSLLCLALTTTSACASYEPEFSIVHVDGTDFAQVYRNGVPLVPGSYTVVAYPEMAVVYVGGRAVGVAPVQHVQADDPSLTLTIRPERDGTSTVIIQP